MKEPTSIHPPLRMYCTHPCSIFFILLFLFLSLVPRETHAARKGVLWIQVFEMNTNHTIPGCEVTFKGTAIKCSTDKDGEVGIELLEGTYSVSLIKDGYYNSVYENIQVKAGQVNRIHCDLLPGDPAQQFFFGIGGINVVDRKSVLSQEIETTHEITSAEIEHHLSTNLGDILDLVPGVERTKAPGLSAKTQVALRGTGYIGDANDQKAALFGAKIIVDDIPISNNANLQSGVGTSYGQTSTTAGSGIDLRTIPADNIERVEVITGIPSVEYGDMTSGLVKVRTKAGRQPHRLKLKSNPDTKEANLSGSFNPKGVGLAYNVNYAYSERNPRRDGDEYSRYNGQLIVRNKFLNDKGSLLNKFFYTGVLDETHLNESDPLAIVQSNKDKSFAYGHTFEYKLSETAKLEWIASVDYTKRDSYQQKLQGADTRVLSDAMQPGTNVGVLSGGAYLFKVWTKGAEWSVNAKLNYRKEFDLMGLGQSFLLGGQYTFDNNVGQGEIFNPLEPPYGDLGHRPLPFDASPALDAANLYAEDEIKGLLFMRPYTLELGFRYEMYRPYELNPGGLFNGEEFMRSKNGTFFNPRLGMKYELLKDTQLRAGWGKSSKMPSLTTIYHGPEYIDIVEENISPPDSVPLVSTYVFDFNTPDIKGYQNEKGEISIDQKIGSLGMIFTGFYSRSDGIPRSVITPLILHRYRWEGWPDPNSRTVIDTIYTEPGTTHQYRENLGWYKNYGLEAQLTTRRIKKLNTIFRLTASFVRSRSGSDGILMSSSRKNEALGRTIYPFYRATESWRQKMIVNYSADWFFNKVGMWTTFFLQQTLFDEDVNYDDPYVYALSYYDPIEGRTVYLSPAESDALGLTRHYDELDLIVQKRPNDRFLFNINVTKSLGKGAEVSLFVHNVFDDAAYYLDAYGYWRLRNPNIFYGVEVSLILDEFWRKEKRSE